MKLKFLGTGQDAGVPHTNCHCDICDAARRDTSRRRLGPSIAVYDEGQRFAYMFDASPDLREQIEMVREEVPEVDRKGPVPLSGIFLTHAHLGHVGGLWFLGRESVEEQEMPIYCTHKMGSFLGYNYPYSLMVSRGNIELRAVQICGRLELEGFSVTSFPVPHRDEIADTVGYLIDTGDLTVYLPDLDRWTEDLLRIVRNVDTLIVDGTFFHSSDLERIKDVPHPPVEDSVKVLTGSKPRIIFTHINHTNPLNSDGEELEWLRSRGFEVAHDGMIIDI